MLLRDKVCMIVGAASPRGIGHATATMFARHGATLAVVDVAMDDATVAAMAASIREATGVEPKLAGFACDIRDRAACERVVAEAVARFGTLDCLVNCAGIVKTEGLLAIAEADYDAVLDVNLKGAFNVGRAAVEVFAARGCGVVINLASVAAQRGGGLVGGAHYAASKGGVVSLTRAIAREFGPRGVRANVVCPSMVETGMLDGRVTAKQFEEIVAGIPLRRAGLPADVAGVCLFLASDLAAYVTGATIDVNGGSHIH